jgi:hypothetical protein
MAFPPGPKRIEARSLAGGQRLPAGFCRVLVNLFHFGTFSAADCSAPATLDLNLIGGRLRVWTKFRSGNTLADVLHH